MTLKKKVSLSVSSFLLILLFMNCGDQPFFGSLHNQSYSSHPNQPTLPIDPTPPPTIPPIQGPTGTWSRLDPGNSGPFNAYFYQSCIIGGGDIWMAWGDPSVGNFYGSFIFRAATNKWERTNTISNDPTKNIGKRENYDCTYDSTRNRVWIGHGAPVAYANLAPAPAGPQFGELGYDVATDLYSTVFPSYPPAPATISKGDGAFIYFNNSLWAFGGWSIDPGQQLSTHNLSTDVRTSNLAAASTPPFTEDPGRYTASRSGVNSKTGILWALADQGELYTLDTKVTPYIWSKIITTGQKPGKLNFVAALDENTNKIIAYVGKAGMVVADNAANIGDTYILDLTSNSWAFGARSTNGDMVPPMANQSAYAINYDPVNKRIILTYSMDTGTQVWAFTP